MLLAFLQEIEDVSAQFVRIISPIPINFPVGTCQRIPVLDTPSAYCCVCLRQFLIQAHTHDGSRDASRDRCTPLGPRLSRQFKQVQHTKSMPGAPDGDYVVMQFDTRFANKQAAVETVTFMQEKHGTWKAVGSYSK